MLEAIYEWDYRLYPSLLALALGAYLFTRGFYRRTLPPEEPAHALAFARGFRLLIAGGTMVAAGLGWWLQIPWLLVAALCIFAEEMFETSIMVSALKAEVKQTARRQPAAASRSQSGN